MALNEHLRDADRVSLPVPNSTASGAPVKVGGLNAVTQTSTGTGGVPTGGNANGSATCWLSGSHILTVTGVTAPGTPVYITAANALDVAATGNTPFGHALGTKTAAAGPVPVRIAN